MKTMKRLLAMLLVLALTLSNLPVAALASELAEPEVQETVAEETAVPEEEAAEETPDAPEEEPVKETTARIEPRSAGLTTVGFYSTPGANSGSQITALTLDPDVTNRFYYCVDPSSTDIVGDDQWGTYTGTVLPKTLDLHYDGNSANGPANFADVRTVSSNVYEITLTDDFYEHPNFTDGGWTDGSVILWCNITVDRHYSYYEEWEGIGWTDDGTSEDKFNTYTASITLRLEEDPEGDIIVMPPIIYPQDPAHPPYLTCHWLGNDGEGWYQQEDQDYDGFRVMPGQEVQLVFFLNYWHEGQYVKMPTHVKPVSGDLNLELIGSENAAPGEQATEYFYRITTNTWDQHIDLVAANDESVGGVMAHTDRNEICVYNSPVISNATCVTGNFLYDFTDGAENPMYVAFDNDGWETVTIVPEWGNLRLEDTQDPRVKRIILGDDAMWGLGQGFDQYFAIRADAYSNDGNHNQFYVNFCVVPDPATMPHDPYISYGWLNNMGDGFYVNEEPSNDYFMLTPGVDQARVFVLNTWDEAKQAYVKTPVIPQNDYGLTVEPVPSWEIAPDQAYGEGFAWVINPGIWDVEVPLYVTLEDGTKVYGVTVDTSRPELCVYNSPNPSNETYIYEYKADYNSDENSFYLCVDSEWASPSGAPYIRDGGDYSRYFTFEKATDTAYKVTLTREYLDHLLNIGGHDWYGGFSWDLKNQNGDVYTHGIPYGLHIYLDPATVPHDPYLTFGWLDNWGEGVFDPGEWHENEGFNICPGDEFLQIYFLNLWDEERQEFVKHPVSPSQLKSGGLNFAQAEDVREDQTNGTYFTKVTAKESAFRQDVEIYVMHEGKKVSLYATVDLHRVAFYRTPDVHYSNRLMEPLEIDPDGENVVYLGINDKADFVAYDVTLVEECQGLAQIQKINDNVWKLTATQEAIDQTLNRYILGVGLRVSLRHKSDPNWIEEEWLQFDLSRMALKTKGSFNLNHEFYEILDNGYIRNYPTGEFDEWGNEIWAAQVTQLPEGLSYDFNTNTLTMENYHGKAIGFHYESMDHDTGEVWYNLPSDTLTVNLIGENSLISEQGSAADFNNGLNVVFTGDGSLHIKSTNKNQKDMDGHGYSYPALWIHNGDLTFQGNVNVTVEIAGQAMDSCWDESGYIGETPAHLIALNGHMMSITLKDNATLTTLVPEGGRSNGPKLPEDHEHVFWGHRYPGGYTGINGLTGLQISGGTLNTSDLLLNEIFTDDGKIISPMYVQTGGTVNIDSLGFYNEYEQWQWNEETQQDELLGISDRMFFTGLELGQGSKLSISGGRLNINVDADIDPAVMHSSFSGINLWGATLELSGGEINILPGYDGNMINARTGLLENGSLCPSKVNITGGKLNLDGKDDCRVVAMDLNPDSIFTLTGGTIEASQADFRMGGDVTIDGGTLRGVNLDYYSDNTFKFNSGLISLQEESSIMMGMGEMNGGTMDLNRTGVVVLGGFQFNGGQIRIVNKGEDIFWPGLIVETYMAMNNDAKLVLEHSALAPAMEVRGTFHQMDNSTVTIDHYSYAGEAALFVPGVEERFGTLLLNDGTVTIRGLDGQQVMGLRMDQTSVAEFGEGDFNLTNANVEFNGKVVMHDNTFTMEGGTVFVQTPGEVILNNADFRLVTTLEERPDPEEWYIAFLASVGTKFAVNGGSLTVDSQGYDCAFDLCGDYTQTDGTVTAKGDNIAMAVKGISDISGGTLNLTGEFGYNHNFLPDITTNSKTIISGGTLNIDAKRIGMGLDSTTEITGGQINVKISGYELDDPELGKVCVGLGIVVDSAAGGNPKLVISGGKVNVDVPQDAKGCEIKNLYGILAIDSKVEILDGELDLKARDVLVIESADESDMLLLSENLAAISQVTGKQLYPLVDTIYVDENGQQVAPGQGAELRYYGCFEEDNKPSAGSLTEEMALVSHLVIREAAPSGIEILESDVEELAPGQTATITATTTDPDAQLVWTLADGDKNFVTLKVNKNNTATVTAKKNKELREVTVTVSVKGGTGSKSLTLAVLPITSKVRILDPADNDLTGKTLSYYMGTENNILPLTVVNEPVDALQAVTWKSSNEKYATVDENGLVNILMPGKSVTITATATDGSNKKATLKIKTVLPIYEIKLPESTVCAVGKTVNLKPELLPANATDGNVIWEIVEGKEFASISNGKLKGIAAGEAVVRISARWNPDIFAECRVQVYPAVKQVDILLDQEIVTKKTLTLLMSTDGENSLQLYAESMPDGSFQDVTWKSSNDKYVTVDETGKVTALEAGKTVTITATATDGSGRKATVKIKTEQPVEELTITGSDVAAAGKTISLAASIYPANATNKKVKWSIVEGSEYASISTSGKLKVNKKVQDGQTVTVRLEWAGNTEDYEITTERTVTLYTVAASGVDIVDTEGSSITKQLVLSMSSFSANSIELDALVKSSEAAQEVLWKSSNEKYAIVDEDGTVTILVPDKSVTITATAADGSGKKDSVKVKGIQPMEDLTLKEELLDKDGCLFVAGGKSLKLATAVNILPQLTSNKKLNWTVEKNDYGIKINASTGVLTTKKVSEPVTVEVNAEAKDESGVSICFFVNVYPAATKVSIWYQGREMTTKDKLEYGPGSQLALTAKTLPENAAQEYTWKVSNKKYATVDENGVVTLLDAIGKTVTITATSADGTNKKATLKIKIVEAPPMVLPDLGAEEKAEAEAEIRRALSLLIDRQAASFGQMPANGFVPMGMTDVDGSQFYQNAVYWDPYAYEANCAEAMKILSRYYPVDARGKLVGFPTLTYLYNEGSGHKAIAEVIQQNLLRYGIQLKLEEMEWGPMLETRQEGNYQIARNGWLSDYNDPICMLDMWTSYSGNNDAQFGKGAHAQVAIYDLDLTPWGYNLRVENGTWAETYDVLISTIKSCSDASVRYQLMHLAEDMLMETGCLVPLYYYTDNYLLDSSVTGFGASPMGLKFFHKTKVNGSGDQITVNLMAEDDFLDPALIASVDASSMVAHLFAGLAKLAPDASGNYSRIVADCAEELVEPVVNRDGTVTYTYTLKEGLTWSDGVELTAHDFEFAWKRAASWELGAAYGYMFEYIKGYYEDDLAVTAIDDRTLTVTLTSNIPYWNELLAFSTFMPVREDVVSNENWAFSAETFVSNGAYTVSDWEHGSVITLQKNSRYHDAADVTMNTIHVISYGDIQKLWKNGQLQFVESEFEGMNHYGEEFVVGSALGTYYANFNINTQLLP